MAVAGRAWICALVWALTSPVVPLVAGEDLAKHANQLAELMLRSKSGIENAQWKAIRAATEEELAQTIALTQGLPQWILKAELGARACSDLNALFEKPSSVPQEWFSKAEIERRQEKALSLYAKPENVQWWHLGLLRPGNPKFFLEGIGKIAHPDSLPLLESCHKWKIPSLNSKQLVAEQRRYIAEAIGRFQTLPALEVLFRLWMDPAYSEAEKETLVAIVADNPAWNPAIAAFSANQAKEGLEFTKQIERERSRRGQSAADTPKLCLRIASLQSSLKPLTPEEIKELSDLIAQLHRVPEYALKGILDNPDINGLAQLIVWAELGSRDSEITEILQALRKQKQSSAEKDFLRVYSGRNPAWWAQGLLYSEGSRELQFYLTGAMTRPKPQVVDVVEEIYTWKPVREVEAGRDVPVRQFLIDAALKSSPDDCVDLLARFWRNPTSTEAEKNDLAAAAIKLEAGFRYDVERRIFERGKERPGVSEFLKFVEAQRAAKQAKP